MNRAKTHSQNVVTVTNGGTSSSSNNARANNNNNFNNNTYLSNTRRSNLTLGSYMGELFNKNESEKASSSNIKSQGDYRLRIGTSCKNGPISDGFYSMGTESRRDFQKQRRKLSKASSSENSNVSSLLKDDSENLLKTVENEDVAKSKKKFEYWYFDEISKGFYYENQGGRGWRKDKNTLKKTQASTEEKSNVLPVNQAVSAQTLGVLNSEKAAKFYDPVSDGYYYEIPSVDGWVRRNNQNRNSVRLGSLNSQQFVGGQQQLAQQRAQFAPFNQIIQQQSQYCRQFNMPPSPSSSSIHFYNPIDRMSQPQLPRPIERQVLGAGHSKDLTDAEVENIIVHSQSAPRESTIFEREKGCGTAQNLCGLAIPGNFFVQSSLLGHSAAERPRLAPLHSSYAAYQQSNSPPETSFTVLSRNTYSPVPLYQRQALHSLPKPGGVSSRLEAVNSPVSGVTVGAPSKQKFNRVIQRGINRDKAKDEHPACVIIAKSNALSVGSFEDPIECDYSDDGEKPVKSLKKVSSLSSIDDSLTTLSHLSDLNISDDNQMPNQQKENSLALDSSSDGHNSTIKTTDRPSSLNFSPMSVQNQPIPVFKDSLFFNSQQQLDGLKFLVSENNLSNLPALITPNDEDYLSRMSFAGVVGCGAAKMDLGQMLEIIGASNVPLNNPMGETTENPLPLADYKKTFEEIWSFPIENFPVFNRY